MHTVTVTNNYNINKQHITDSYKHVLHKSQAISGIILIGGWQDGKTKSVLKLLDSGMTGGNMGQAVRVANAENDPEIDPHQGHKANSNDESGTETTS